MYFHFLNFIYLQHFYFRDIKFIFQQHDVTHRRDGRAMAAGKKHIPNPFRIHGVVEGEAFADREAELARLVAALQEGGSKLIMYGPRRMGKTSVILRAISQINSSGGFGLSADLSTASSAADMSNRLLVSAGSLLGRTMSDFITDLVSRLTLSITLSADPVSGMVLPGLDLQARDWTAEKQRQTLTDVLDALNAMALKRGIIIGIALDEFQEITTLGGERAEWHLRGAMQRHHNLAYVLAGSRGHLIEAMTGPSGAFYKFADKMPFGSIDAQVLSQWIDERFRSTGITADGAGPAILAAGGSRTRDCIQLARVCHDRARLRGRVTSDDVEAALREIVEEEHDIHLTQWRRLTGLKQNVLRAIAAAEGGLSTRDVIRRFALGSSGSAINAANAMVDAGMLLREDALTRERVDTPTGYAFDSPFFRAWVWWNALQDMGGTMSGMVREGPFTFRR
jgi:hypothetical protein